MIYAMFWIFLILYGGILLLISPKAVSYEGFFKGVDDKGKETSTVMLTSSIFISWIFAKSVTNAANLGAKYGLVGGVAYAAYWLCIPLAGFVIYRLRTRYDAKGIVSFLNKNYGESATIFFTIAIFIRLFNEIWSNTSVVGGYYGSSGTKSFIIAAIFFTFVTLTYSIKGGLRSSIFTDFIQTVIFVFFLFLVLFIILPKEQASSYIDKGTWSLNHGVDLLLVSLLQIFSYPFHDPVLTDRGFINEEKKMLKSYIIAGVLGFVAILGFSFIGIYAKINGYEVTDNIPVEIASAMGVATFFMMTIIMVSSAGSTLDSTFSSLSKLTAVDLPKVMGKSIDKNNAKKIGMIIMAVFAIIGNLPMIIGTDILKATTISGTMVMGFAPIFCLHGLVNPTKLGFQLSFWIGIIMGILLTVGIMPDFVAIGTGDNAMLLGTNLYGLILCTISYIVPGIIKRGELA